MGLDADPRLLKILAENLRCRAIFETQKEAHQWEARSSLPEDLLTPSVLLSALARLLKNWREKKMPPAKFGKDFERIIALYHEGGLAAVDQLIASASHALRAKALTALARALMSQDPAEAARMARLAYTAEPRAFRCKWLAFRLYEAGDAILADALLEILPSDVKFSESETRQASRVRDEAWQAHLREAGRQYKKWERESWLNSLS